MTAIDVSAEMLADCRQAHGDVGGRVEYQVVDGVDLYPLSGRRFDCVYAVSVFVHMEYWQLFTILRQLPALMQPGAALAFDHITPALPDLLERTADYVLAHGQLPWTFYRLLSRDMLLILLERAGFERAACEWSGDFMRARTPLVDPDQDAAEINGQPVEYDGPNAGPAREVAEDPPAVAVQPHQAVDARLSSLRVDREQLTAIADL